MRSPKPPNTSSAVRPSRTPGILTALFLLTAALFSGYAQNIPGGSIPRGDFRIQAELPLQREDLTAFSFLNDDDRASLMSSGELIYRHGREFSPRLLSDRTLAGELEQEHRDKGNNFAMEVLMAVDIPAELLALEAGDDSNLQESHQASRQDLNLDLHIYNLLHRISSLAGTEYFSASRGRMREFYLSSTVVQDAEGQIPLPDPIFDSIPAESSFLIRQEDASFGDNIYRVHVSRGEIRISNVSRIIYNFIPIAGPGDLELLIHITRQGDRLFFYGLSSLRAPRIFGIQDRVGDSFYNRLIALYRWFSGQLVLTEF